MQIAMSPKLTLDLEKGQKKLQFCEVLHKYTYLHQGKDSRRYSQCGCFSEALLSPKILLHQEINHLFYS